MDPAGVQKSTELLVWPQRWFKWDFIIRLQSIGKNIRNQINIPEILPRSARHESTLYGKAWMIKLSILKEQVKQRVPCTLQTRLLLSALHFHKCKPQCIRLSQAGLATAWKIPRVREHMEPEVQWEVADIIHTVRSLVPRTRMSNFSAALHYDFLPLGLARLPLHWLIQLHQRMDSTRLVHTGSSVQTLILQQ